MNIIGRWTDIAGAALFLGLLLRFYKPATELIAVSGRTATDAFRVVSLQDTAPANVSRNV